MLAVAHDSDRPDGSSGSVLHLPSPRAVLRHAVPTVFEGILGPLALFYLVLVVVGFRAALLAALGWSYVALARRLLKGERASALLLLGTLLVTLRTAVSFVTGSAFLYFAQPLAGAVVIACVLLGSAAIRRPFTQRFAHDFCPLHPDLLGRPDVRRFFVRISVLWAAVLLVNAAFVLWLLTSSSLQAFVLERSVVTYTLTAGAIFFSITRFMAVMRRDGVLVVWGPWRPQALQPQPA